MTTRPLERDSRPRAVRLRRPRAARRRPASRGRWPTTSAPDPEASWGPREVLAHVAEMLPFWLGELERVIDGDGPAPVPFGRLGRGPDPASGSSSATGRLPLRVLFARIDAGLARLAGSSGPTLTDDGRRRIGVHPRLGRDDRRRPSGPVRHRPRRGPRRAARATSSRTRRLTTAAEPCSSSIAIPIGVLIGLLVGGRLERLGQLRFHWAWLAIAGLAIQIVLFSTPSADSLPPSVGDRRSTSPRRGLVLIAVCATSRSRASPSSRSGRSRNLAAIVGQRRGDAGRPRRRRARPGWRARRASRTASSWRIRRCAR